MLKCPCGPEWDERRTVGLEETQVPEAPHVLRAESVARGVLQHADAHDGPTRVSHKRLRLGTESVSGRQTAQGVVTVAAAMAKGLSQ